MSETATPPTIRTIAYIDGFNLYFGMLKDNPSLKWLDIQCLMDNLRVHEKVTDIRYFTALVDPDRLTPSRLRQNDYLLALSLRDRVRIFYGKYQPRTVTCRASCRETYEVPEEKKTDVRIAVQMMADSFSGLMDRIVLVSGDSDLEPAIEWIVQRYRSMKVTVYVPQLETNKNKRRNDMYRSMGADVKALPLGELARSQFLAIEKLPSGRSLLRPPAWS